MPARRKNPELFWAIRGGGGNFGIVTAFDFAAHPTTDVFYGTIVFPASEAASVLQGWADYLRSAPDELTSVVTLANPVAGGPEASLEIHVVVDGDDPDLAADALDPIRHLGTVIDDRVALTPYADTLEDGAIPPPGIQFVTRSAFVNNESVPEVLLILAEVAASKGSPVIGLRSVSGAVSRVPNDATAYAHRQAELMLLTLTAGPDPVVAAARPALDAIWGKLAPHVRGAYANFLSSATDEDVAAIYPAETLRRLAAVKGQYDPGNLFARNHNVRPRSKSLQTSSPSPPAPRPSAKASLGNADGAGDTEGGVMTRTKTTRGLPIAEPSARPGLILSTVAVVQFLVSLDLAIVNVALPRIGVGLGFSPVGLTWVINAYALTFGGLLLLGGKAADRYGRRRLLFFGLGLFGMASLAGGLAQTPAQLVAARAVQGVGAATLAPAALSLLTATFPEGRARIRAFGAWSAVNAAGGAFGVLAGGLLTEYLGWRWVMFVNLPMVAAALTLAVRSIAPDRPATARRGRPDLLGAILATAGLGLLVLGVVRTDQQSWTSAVTVTTLATAVVLLVGFIRVERMPAREPLLRLGLLTNRSVAGANAYNLVLGAVMASAFYFVTLYLQRVLGTGPAETGLMFLPFALGVIAGSVFAVKLGYRVAPRTLLIAGGAAHGYRVRLVQPDQPGRVLPHRRPGPGDPRQCRLRPLPGPGRLGRHRRSRALRNRNGVRAAQQLPTDRSLARAGRPGHRCLPPHRTRADSQGPHRRVRPRPRPRRWAHRRRSPHRRAGAAPVPPS